MARLESQSRLLYYPTPDIVNDMLSTYFRGEGVRLADPCCGEGLALKRFSANMKNAELIGIELSYYRAQKARQRLNTVLPTSFYDVKWDEKSVGLIFNNPPYDWSDRKDKEEKRIRHEVLFVTGCTPKLVDGGHQIVIIPRVLLGHIGLMKHLAGWYKTLIVRRFPDGEYERFSQIVILACEKRDTYVPPSDEDVLTLTALAEEKDVAVLEPGEEQFIIPQSPEKFRFTYRAYLEKDLVDAAKACNPIETQEWTKLTRVDPLGGAINPAVPLQLGHMTMLISGQNVGVMELSEDNGAKFLLKGMTTKQELINNDPIQDDRGRQTGVNVTITEKLVTTVCTATQAGVLTCETDGEKVGGIITKHAVKIADAILKKNTPIYDFHPTQEEWRTVSKIGIGLPPLPGRKERGLFDMQKHFAVAMKRVMKRMGTVIGNMDMGTGKTATTIGAMALMDVWPNVVVCPGQLVFKWKREIEVACDPEKPIVGRVITRPTMLEENWTKARKLIEEHGTIIETYKKQSNPQTDKDIPGTRFVRIKSTQIGRLAKVFQHAMFTIGKVKPAVSLTEDGITVEYPDKDDYTLEDFITDWKGGRLGERAVAICSVDSAKYDAGDSLEFKLKQVQGAENKVFYICPECGGELEKKYRFCPNQVYIGMKDGEKVYRTCGAPLFEMSRWRRTGLARLVQQKYPKFFKIYISDETHKAKGGRTDAGVSDQRLISATQYSIALTGTLFGGNASSLFYLLYRRLRAVRNRFLLTEQTKWIEEYGILEKCWSQGRPYEGEVGKATGVQRWAYREKELPGISPSVIQYLLPITLFGEISDLGYDLPPINEKVVWVDMGEKLEDHYATYNSKIFDKAIQLAKDDHDPGGLSVWFSTMRRRTSSAFRMEIAEYTSNKPNAAGFKFQLDPITNNNGHKWLPKEQELARIVKTNMGLNRKTLVYVEQSATRDIRDRLEEALSKLAPGCRVGKLSAGDMSPAKRELWIKTASRNMDVLLCNPKLVETGLDLIMFSDIAFYESPTSLYTMWQAMRRVWRLGQKNNVMVWFLAHAGTVEANLLYRMGKKKRAAQLLYGKSAGGVLVEQEGSDVMTELLRDALDGKVAGTAREAIQDIHIFVDETREPRATQVAIENDGTEQETFILNTELNTELPEPLILDAPEIILPVVPIDELPLADVVEPEIVLEDPPTISTSKSPFRKFDPAKMKGVTGQLGLFGDFVEIKKKR